MKTALLFILFMFGIVRPEVSELSSVQKNIHFRWQQQLEVYVNDQGDVNYKGWKTQEKELEAYITTLEQFPPADYWSKAETLSYWINAYNALTVQLILEHYPLESIRDLKDPWDTPRFRLGDQRYSLGNIEHDILRKMDEPRIHFAINCASVSCPKLQKEAFMPRQLEEQLEEATKEFILDPKKNKIHPEQLELSRIFLWFGKDFGTKEERLTFISNYSGVELTRPKIDYLTYDWALNE